MVETTTYTDQEIIERVLDGEKALFEIIVRRYNATLYKVGRGYNFGLEDTKDLMQETFIQAYQHLGAFEYRSSFKTWLIRIMLNSCYRRRHRLKDRMSREQLRDLCDDDLNKLSVVNNNIDRFMVRRDLGRIIEAALEHIPDNYRLVFTLREINGLSTAETSRVLDISETNVKVSLSRAKTLLRKEISRDFNATELFEFNLVHCDEIVSNVMAYVLK